MCSPEHIIFDEARGEYICIENGEVLQDHVPDLGPEWRFFDIHSSVSRERSGAPLTNKVHDKGLTTRIDTSTRLGRRLDRLNKRLRAINVREKRLVKALELMNDVIGRLNIPNSSQLKETAGFIVNKLFRHGLIKKKNMRAMVAVSIIIASNNLGIPMSHVRIQELCQVTSQEIWDAEMKIRRDSGGIISVKPVDPRMFLNQMAYKADLPSGAVTLASNILRTARKYGLTSGKGPRGLAAAALYIASILLNNRKTQQDMARSVDVSEVTIRNRYRDLVDNILIVTDL